MANIEIKDNIESKVLKIIEKKMIEGGYRNRYGKLEVINIGNDIFSLKSLRTKNIQGFYDNKGELIFNIYGLIEDFGEGKVEKEKFETGKVKVNNILEKMGYKWYKDPNGHYHMIEIKTGKEIHQESLKYYEIFETLGNIQYRDYLSDVIYEKGLKEEGEKLKKMPNLREQMDEVIFPELENMSKFYVLKPVELLLFKKYGIIEENHFKELKKKVYSFEYIEKLIENLVWDYVEGKITTKKIQGKIYKLNTNQITENELKLYLDLNIINKEEYKLLKDILEKRKLEQEKKEHIDKTRKHISSLENNVIDNLG